jgi:hypothetical protein
LDKNKDQLGLIYQNTEHIQVLNNYGYCHSQSIGETNCAYKGIVHLCTRKCAKASHDNATFDVKASLEYFLDYFGRYQFDDTPRFNDPHHRDDRFVDFLELKTFSDGELDPPNPYVFVARQAVSAKLIDELIDLAKRENFTVGVKGGKDTFMRCSTTEPVSDDKVPDFPRTKEYTENNKTKMYPFMLIGKGGTERMYKCYQATELEKRLMNLADKVVMITSNGQIMCQHNLLQWVVSEANKCYDFHTDANEWTTKGTFQNDSYTSSSGIPLPSIEDAFTLTIAITRFPDPEKAVKITWKRSEMGEKARWSIVMTGNDIHFQLPRTQGFGILHAGEKAEESMMMSALQKIGMKITESLSSTEALADLTTKKQGNWRMVLSFRQVVSATSCPACYLMRFDQRPVLLKKPFLGSSTDNIVTGPLCIMENSIMHPEKSCKMKIKLPKPKRKLIHNQRQKTYKTH